MDYHDYIWDLGGTLLDNYEVSTQAFIASLKKYGIEASHDEVYVKLKESTREAVDFFIPNEETFLHQYKMLEAEYLKQPVLCKGARDVLAKIVADGGRNFLISHRNKLVLTILETTNLNSYFTEVVTSENGFARKPDPESLLYLKEKYQMSSALVIGDRDIDRQAGEAVGFAALLVDNKKSLMELVN
ncbi:MULTISPECIES: HAD-IA family hydrolase [Streptococcus]|uniref:HAD-IA family hydrolase n=1 Tax=Streptococcus caledonicus TaxID=2614158 RepID=A0ABW0UEH8_9STRE|nr:HAD-IA family hydrolase [Streptococcus sp. S784/96/1]